eukprot:g48611.t1
MQSYRNAYRSPLTDDIPYGSFRSHHTGLDGALDLRDWDPLGTEEVKPRTEEVKTSLCEKLLGGLLRYSVLTSVACQALWIGVCKLLFRPTAGASFSALHEWSVAYCTFTFLLISVQAAQSALATGVLWNLVSGFANKVPTGQQVMACYLTTTISFAGLQCLLLTFSANAYTLPPPTAELGLHPLRAFVGLVYLAASTMSGRCDAAFQPATVPSEMLAVAQRLVGFFLSTVIFAYGVHHFRLQYKLGRSRRRSTRWCFQIFRRYFISFEPVRRVFLHHMLIIMVSIQLVVMCILVLSDRSAFSHADPAANNSPAAIECQVVEILQFILALMAVLRLLRQWHDRDLVSAIFLLQSFLSTIVAFAGLCVLLMLDYESSFLFAQHDPGDLSVPAVMWEFVYFSAATMTFSNHSGLSPNSITAQIVVTLQLWTAVAYLCLISGFGTAVLLSKAAQARRSLESPSGSLFTSTTPHRQYS